MPVLQGKNRTNLFKLLVIALIIIAGTLLWNRGQDGPGKKDFTPVKQSAPKPIPVEDGVVVVMGTIGPLPEIDFSKLDEKNEYSRLMDQRKQELGIGKSLDMIIKSNEAFKVGKTTVYMREILEKSILKKSRVFEEKIKESGDVVPETTDEYGIYVVQPGDNIWNIHFRIIQDYYGARGVSISSQADEPRNKGYSSGVGKLLKFSEAIVTIYNLLEKTIVTDIDLIEPLSKIVVYNMNEVFSLLQEIDYDNVDTIRFDGETIWIPAQQPDKKAIN